MSWTDDKFSTIPIIDRGGDGCLILPGEILGYKQDGEWIVDNCTGWRRDYPNDGIVVKFDHGRLGFVTTVPIEDVRRLSDERDAEIAALREQVAALTRERDELRAAQMLALSATAYDYNRAGIIAFKIAADLPPSRMDDLKTFMKSLADERTPLRVIVNLEHPATAPGDASTEGGDSGR